MKYPFNPQLLDALPEELAELFRELENTLLIEICSRLKLKDQLNEVTVQDIKALRSHGIDPKDIKKAIKKTTGIADDKLNKLLDDVVERNQQYYTELIDIAKVTQPAVLVDALTIAAIKEQCQREFGNITRSMGFLVDAGRTMLEPAKAYQWALDSAAMQIESGAISYNEAIRSAVKQLAESGLKTVNYESGHVDRIDVAARRAVMTGVNQLNRKYSEQSMDFLKTDLVHVEAHAGARDIDGVKGWENHKAWQGKIYRWAVFTRRYPDASKGKYKDFERTCGYGDVQGILGANCRHSWSSFVEGVMEPTYTQEYLDHIDDGLGCDFDGKHYSAYEATQMQRRLERTIKAQKELKNAYKSAGLNEDAQTANIKLRRLNTKYREFSKAAGLPEQRERTKVTYISEKTEAKVQRVKAQRAAEAAKVDSQTTPQYVDVTAQWRENATPNSHTVQDAREYIKDGVTYRVDGHNVVLDYSPHEKEIAELLEREFGGELYMVPRVNNPKNVSTPDYLFRGVGYDLKTIGKTTGKNPLFNRVKNAKGQARNFVLDITDAELQISFINEQIDKVFWSNNTKFVDTVILIKSGKTLKIIKRA